MRKKQLAYLGPEPDRWREKSELALKLSQEPDHFIDLELVEGMTLAAGPLQLLSRSSMPSGSRLRASPTRCCRKRLDCNPTSPWRCLAGWWWRSANIVMRCATTRARSLPSAMRFSTPDGWGTMSADGANPLHTSVNYNGWTTANPNGYTTAKTIHWKMEGEFVAANLKQLQFAALVPEKATKLENPFQDYLAYLHKSNGYVEQVYQLEKAGGFAGAGTPQSREFIEQRMACGAEMLRNLWYTAWLDSAVDPPPYVAPKPASAPPDMKTTPKMGETSPQPGEIA